MACHKDWWQRVARSSHVVVDSDDGADVLRSALEIVVQRVENCCEEQCPRPKVANNNLVSSGPDFNAIRAFRFISISTTFAYIVAGTSFAAVWTREAVVIGEILAIVAARALVRSATAGTASR